MSLASFAAAAVRAAEDYEKNKLLSELRSKLIRILEQIRHASDIVGSASYSASDPKAPLMGIFTQGDDALAISLSPERLVILTQDNRSRAFRHKAVALTSVGPEPDMMKTQVFELPPYQAQILPRMNQPQHETPMLFAGSSAPPRPAFETPMLQAHLAPRSFARAAFAPPKATGCDCDRCRARRHKHKH